jgi:uncharacterized membrane protein YeiH
MSLNYASLLFFIDIAGVLVFAMSGALVAARKQLDIVGFCLIGIVTGLGGGTIRDLLLGTVKTGTIEVFWLDKSFYLYLCIAGAVFVFFFHHMVNSRYRAVLWADAIGLSLFAVEGAKRALSAGIDPSAAVLLGVITATFGGIIRDVICREDSPILRKEIYITAAFTGAALYAALGPLDFLSETVRTLIAIAAAFALRAAALTFDLTLPGFRQRPPA